jgi:hypothetical protein
MHQIAMMVGAAVGAAGTWAFWGILPADVRPCLLLVLTAAGAAFAVVITAAGKRLAEWIAG